MSIWSQNVSVGPLDKNKFLWNHCSLFFAIEGGFLRCKFHLVALSGDNWPCYSLIFPQLMIYEGTLGQNFVNLEIYNQSWHTANSRSIPVLENSAIYHFKFKNFPKKCIQVLNLSLIEAKKQSWEFISCCPVEDFIKHINRDEPFPDFSRIPLFTQIFRLIIWS